MNEKDKNKIMSLVDWKKNLKNTEGMDEEYYWKPLIEILTKDEKETIEFLSTCNDETLYWISEVFEDISEKFNSKEFVEFLKELEKQHPGADIGKDVKYAEYKIED